MIPSEPADPVRSAEAIRQEAADWFVLRDRGLDAAQEARLDRWLQADSRHGEALAELERTWELLEAAEPVPAAPAQPTEAWKRVWIPLALAAGLAAALLHNYQFPFHRAGEPAVSALTAETAVGETRELRLADGSRMLLNTDSAVAVNMTGHGREVTLQRGEAHFQVVHDSGRPFVVHASGVEVRDVGTVFDVRLRSGAIDVLVTEGEVRVSNAGSARALFAGQRAVIALGGAAAPALAAVDAASAQRALAWREHRLEFDSQPLSEIAAEFNRYNRHKLVIADERLGRLRFGGTWPAGDYESLVRVLQARFGAVAEERGDETVLGLAR